MRAYRIIPCLVLVAACSADEQSIDLGTLADGKADFGGFEIPITVSAGQSSPLFQFSSDDRFTARLDQSLGGAQAQLLAQTPNGTLVSGVSLEPTLSVIPSGAGTKSYSIQVINHSSFALSGTLTVVSADGGTPTSLSLQSYIAGPVATGSAAALQGWQAECDAWRDTMFALSGASQVESYDCGVPKDIGGNAWRYESDPTLEVIASVPPGTEPLVDSRQIEGGTSTSAEVALGMWRDACNSFFFHEQELFGSRLMAARCPRPTEFGGNQWNYKASAEVYLRPLLGDSFTLAGFVSGTTTSGRDTAMASWQAQCDAWLEGQFRRSGADHLGTYSCGTPTDVGGNQWRFESSTQVVVVAQLPEGKSPTTLSQTVEGAVQSDQPSAYASWQAACDLQLDQQSKLWGSRYLGGACAKPTDVGGSAWQYRGSVDIRLLPL